MNTIKLVSFIKELEEICNIYKYELQDFKKWSKNSIKVKIYDNENEDKKDKNMQGVCYINVEFNLETEKVEYNIEGSCSWEGGDFDISLYIDIEFISKIKSVIKKYKEI